MGTDPVQRLWIDRTKGRGMEKAEGVPEPREQGRHCLVSVSVSVMSKKGPRAGVWQPFGAGRAGTGADRGFPPGEAAVRARAGDSCATVSRDPAPASARAR